MKKSNEQHPDFLKPLMLIASMAMILLYRFIIIKDYCSQYTDEDQALMWYGTHLAEHLKITEPHFLGQGYGSMLESVIAVPFHMIGIPLNWAVPFATVLLWYAPFVMIAIYLKRKSLLAAELVICSSLIYRWDYDILTSIPRSFIPGFIFAFVGFVLINEALNTCKKRFIVLGVVLFFVAYISTETTVTVIGLICLYFALYRWKECIHNWKPIGIGAVLGFLLCQYCNVYFYKINPEFNLHGSVTSLSLSFESFILNLRENFVSMIQTFSLFSIQLVPVFLILVMAGMLWWIIRVREWRMLVIFFCALFGSILVLALPKTWDFVNDLMLSQARMFLFIPYIILFLISIIGMEYKGSKFEQFDEETLIKISQFIVAVIAVMVVSKTMIFETSVLQKPELYGGYVISVASTEDMYKAAKTLADVAEETGCHIVVILTDNRTVGYATAAINYGKYESYNAYYDRRTPTYLKFKNSNIDETVMLVETSYYTISRITAYHISGNLIDWLRQEVGLQRYPKHSEWYIDE